MNDDEARAEALTFALHDIIDARTLDEAEMIARRAVSWPIERVLAEHDRAVAEKAWATGVAAVYSDFYGGEYMPDDIDRDHFNRNPYRPLSVSTPKDADA